MVLVVREVEHAVFGITFHLSPDLQHKARQSRLPESERTHVLLEKKKKKFLFCGFGREKKSYTVSRKTVFGADMENNYG